MGDLPSVGGEVLVVPELLVTVGLNNIVWCRADLAGLVCLRELALDEEDVVGDLDVLADSELFQ